MLFALLGALIAQWIAIAAGNAAWGSASTYVSPSVMNSVACTLLIGSEMELRSIADDALLKCCGISRTARMAGASPQRLRWG